MNKVAELEIELKLKDEALKAKDAILKSKLGYQTRLLGFLVKSVLENPVLGQNLAFDGN